MAKYYGQYERYMSHGLTGHEGPNSVFQEGKVAKEEIKPKKVYKNPDFKTIMHGPCDQLHAGTIN
jgi:hypothetical protein